VCVDTTRVDRGASCGSRRMDVAWFGGVEGTYLPAVHANCWHNELSSLAMRTMGVVPEEVDRDPGHSVQRVWRRLRRVVSACYHDPKWTHEETALSYTGRLRRRYLAALEDLKDGLEPRDFMLKPFLKAEKFWAARKKVKPRMIFPRSPKYNLALASYLKPFEHWLWGRLTLRWMGLGPRNERLVMKGLGPVERATVLLRKYRGFAKPVVFEIDGSAFEAHVGAPALRLEHGVYRAAYPRDDDLGRLLQCQLHLQGRSTHGIKFRRSGGRASGDFNTGMGNSLVMLASTAGPLLDMGVPFDLAIDGDNALVFLEERDAQKVYRELGVAIRQACGQEITLERPVYRFEDIRFGQCAPVIGPNDVYVMVRDYREVLSKALATHRYGRSSRGFERYCRGVAECELSCFRGMPVVQAWCLSVLRSLPAGVGSVDKFRDLYVQGLYHVGTQAAKPVSSRTRESFSRAFGLSPEEQLLVEEGFDGLALSSASEVAVPNGSWWGASPGVAEPWAERFLRPGN